MKTIISYTLFFSRENNYLPFLVKNTLVYKGWKLIHSNSSTIMVQYDWELKQLYKDFRTFQREESDTTEISFQRLDNCKNMTIRKTWEG